MYMLTATGGQFSLELANPKQDISLLDIAASLAKINRWTGHTSRLYSVAEHSLHVCNAMEREHGIRNPVALLCGLMHDAHEAYTGDVGTPAKCVLDNLTGGMWSLFERRVQRQVLERWSLLEPAQEWHEQVKRADLHLLATEARDLMPTSERQQSILRQHGHGSLQLALGDYDGMDWTDWRDAFVERFGELRAQAQEPEWRAA